jgi:hypothetical protein
MTFTF